jgi:hypothetical protein
VIESVETFQFGNGIGYDIILSNVNDNNDDIRADVNEIDEMIANVNDTNTNTNTNTHTNMHTNTNANISNNTVSHDYDMKSLTAKLKELTISLHLNNINTYTKSACFWCTHDFDNPPIFIPKYEINETYHCYGCFCSPECATAYLFKEHIDTATRFERYHLINHIYCKIYGYNKNVKPAPDPFYLLNKYYGNLTIQEYRQLLKNERLLIVVDKPLTRTFPELHEDNDDFMFNGKTIPSASKFKLKKNSKKTIKNDIVNENFNIK